MAYKLNLFFDFGSRSSLTLNGKLVDTTGEQIGSIITSGFVNLGNGSYSLYLSVPDGFVGGFIAYSASDPTIDAITSINEEDNPSFINSTVSTFQDTSGQYISSYDADTYFGTRFNSSLWVPTSDTDKTKLLVTATRMIDTLNYAGDKANEDQDLEFPRGTDTTIPRSIRYACCEIAYALLSGFDPEYELRNLSNQQVSFDSSKIKQNDQSFHEARVNGIPSTIAWDFLRPFLRDGSTITLSRVD